MVAILRGDLPPLPSRPKQIKRQAAFVCAESGGRSSCQIGLKGLFHANDATMSTTARPLVGAISLRSVGRRVGTRFTLHWDVGNLADRRSCLIGLGKLRYYVLAQHRYLGTYLGC